MSGLWRYLFRDNPMQVETLRAIRRFTVAGGSSFERKIVVQIFFAMLAVLYAWLLFIVVEFHDDFSPALLWFELALITLIVPGSLYAAISGERERLTWDSLILTRLSPARILVGKLLWRLALLAGVIVLFLPPLLFTHFASHYAKVYSLEILLWIQVCMGAWGVFLATFTLWVSARTRRPTMSLAIVSIFVLGVLILIPGLMSVFDVHTELSVNPDGWLLGEYPPLVYLGSLVVHLNPIYFLARLTQEVINNHTPDFWSETVIVPVFGYRLYDLIPWIYLALSAGCLEGTRRALARLGLPSGSGR